jgi:hypothetical protein
MQKYIIGGLVVLAMLVTIFILGRQISNLKKANTTLIQNNKAYESDILGLQDSISNIRGTYRVTIGELNTSRDRLLTELNAARRELGIKDKEIRDLLHFKSTIKTDTIVVVKPIIVQDSCEFDIEIEYNPQTIFNVSMSKEHGEHVIKHSANISGSFSAFMYETSEWKEPNFWKRLFLFRWGKNYYEENTLISDNEIIQINDFRVIKIQD